MSNTELPSADTRASLRWAVYAVIIVTAAGAMIGRIFAVRSTSGATPFLSANDRSRWCTISAVVDHGTYAIDDVIFREREDGTMELHPDWQTIDRVQHQDRAGNWRYYSSKPPLLPTLLAGEYWLINTVTGASLLHQPFYVGRMMLILSNVVPLVIALFVIALMVERFGGSDFGRVFIVATAAYGTLLTTFAVTLNNHVPAAVSVTIAIYAMLRIWYDGDRQWWLFVLAGVFGAFAAANELPAASLLAALGVALLLKAPVRTVALFVPAAAAVVVPFFWINHAVHDSLELPYAHWRDGEEVFHIDAAVSSRLKGFIFPKSLQEELTKADIEDPQGVPIIVPLSVAKRPGRNWEVGLREAAGGPRLLIIERPARTQRSETGRWVLDCGGKDRYSLVEADGVTRLHKWDNWYDFPASYWAGGQQKGVDAGEPWRPLYFVHMTVGHHGIFSLTPVWILSLIGIVALLANRQRELHALGWAVAAISLVVIAFYVMRPELQRNYGGVSCGLRWLMWLAPLWLLSMIPVVDWIGGGERDRRFWWILAMLLLLMSAASAAYASSNPWTDPWIYQYMDYLGLPLSSRPVLPPV